MSSYKVLNTQCFKNGAFSIVPIRFEDRWDIMKWRNEQIYHLRQARTLTEEDQNAYFVNVVSKLFDQEKPNQILFSFLKGEECIGYGGLVHINWIDKNAEISFIMNTALEDEYFEDLWSKYLELIEQLAFQEICLHKIYTYAFDIRPKLYTVLEKNGFFHEATYKEHVLYNGQMINALVHSKINSGIELFDTSLAELYITYKWANDTVIRAHSFSKEKISFDSHKEWFINKLNSPFCKYYIMKKGVQPIGSIRLDLNESKTEGLISFLIDSENHGKRLGTQILILLETKLIEQGDIGLTLLAQVQSSNIASIKIFRNLGYTEKVDSPEIHRFIKKVT